MDADGGARRALPSRTAKSCGSGAPTLASSSWMNSRTTGARKPGPREEHEGNRNTIAQGMPECFGQPVVTMLVCFHLSHTRLRVRLEHPAFPAPSSSRVVFDLSSGVSRRENAGARLRHCEERMRRSNPESLPGETLDCFACARNDGETSSRGVKRRSDPVLSPLWIASLALAMTGAKRSLFDM
jgi:hypothetical protein